MPVVERVVKGTDTAVIAAHGLAELYAVLTKLPVTPRISPDTARRLIRDNVTAHCTVVALTAREYEQTLDALAEQSIAGGSTYDGIHATCARKTGAQRLYTFNVTDFRLVAPDLADRIVAP